MLGKKQIGIKKRCKINYGFDFEEEFQHWIYVTGAGEEFKYLDNKYEPLNGVDSIKSWRKYIRHKYRENDSEFIYMLKIIRENKKFEAGIIKTIGITVLVGTIFNNFINLFFGEIFNKNSNILMNDNKMNLQSLNILLKNLKLILKYTLSYEIITTVVFFIIILIGLLFLFCNLLKNILQDINRQNLQQMFIESVIDTLIIK